MDFIEDQHYRRVSDSGEKYELLKKVLRNTEIKPRKTIEYDFITLEKNGTITIKKGYRWDGPSCFPDIQEMMKASVVHDAFYDLHRKYGDILNKDTREKADDLFGEMCGEDGLDKTIADAVVKLLHSVGDWIIRFS